ncbi:MAG: ankyrin repeat domain-containing protein [Blastocatellia bacterium]
METSILQDAVRKGDINRVKELLTRRGINVNERENNEYGSTALHLAVSFKNKQIVELLLSKGASVEIKDHDGETPLLHARGNRSDSDSKKNLEIAQLLISKGANVNVQNKNDSTPLLLAVCDVQMELAELLLSHGAALELRDYLGRTPLHYAVSSFSWEKGGRSELKPIIELLLSKGADINTTDNEGSTPLHTAVDKYCEEMAEFLLSRGSEINIRNAFGFTPLQIALKNRHQQLADFLVSRGANDNLAPLETEQMRLNRSLKEAYDSLQDYFKTGGGKGPATLIKEMPEIVHVRWENGETILHLVAKWRSGSEYGYDQKKYFFLKDALSAGADANARDSSGLTPMHLVANSCDQYSVELLVSFGAKVSVKDNRGLTPSMIAKARNCGKLSDYLKGEEKKEKEEEKKERRKAINKSLKKVFTIGWLRKSESIADRWQQLTLQIKKQKYPTRGETISFMGRKPNCIVSHPGSGQEVNLGSGFSPLKPGEEIYWWWDEGEENAKFGFRFECDKTVEVAEATNITAHIHRN